MSERKSWDVQPRRRAAPAPSPAPERAAPQRPAPARVPVRTPAPRQPERAERTESAPVRVRVQPSPRRAAPQPLGALSKRRKQKRRTVRYVLLVFLIFLIAGAFYGLWRPGLRIQNIAVEGPGSDSAKQIVQMNIAGTFMHVIPKNSILFYPKEKIRAAIIDANPDVSAVSLTPTSFSSLLVRTTPRAESFIWCGTALDAPSPDGSCYQSDIEGFLFKQDPAQVVASTSSSTPSVAPAQTEIAVYGPLDKDISNGESPIRAHLVLPSRIPEALKFVDAIRGLGAPVTALGIRGDEADLWIGKSTRITYVLGHESDAALSAATALPNLALTNGSIQYVDLRFPGKAYVKKYGE